MIKEFVAAWDKNKPYLEKYFREHRQEEYDSYEKLVKVLFEVVINPTLGAEYNTYDTEGIHTIDDGDYQGTQIFLLHKNTYQPSVDEYVYTYVYYGSCSGCDTLQGVHQYDYGLPNETQVGCYMSLCLHILQRCHKMLETEDE